ncbi:uncharacterized protein LOC133526889 [Cydia pomonella]|uniref:uncharacterized protein LOC133526889 n=1 Tax=Cydia pomonella TaxID=82600 RepID=UPI002ADDB38D|nr:uncharacterized protein LOC133526889 [Cydia pomonella]
MSTETKLETLMKRMEENMDILRKDFEKHTNSLKESFNTSIASTIEEKLAPLMEENLKLKGDVTVLKNKVHNLEREVRKNNLILHGVEESEQDDTELLELVLQTLNNLAKDGEIESFDKWEISVVRRLGKKRDKKHRPILVKLTLAWRRLQVLKNGKKLPANTYVSEDYPKDVIQIRKDLNIKRQEEIKKGKIAMIRYDKLIIKEKTNQDRTNEKRKRSPTKSPTSDNNNKHNEEAIQVAPTKINKTNAFAIMNRSRSNSLSSSSKQ